MATTDRITVTLIPLFEARMPRNPNAFYLTYVFRTESGEFVYCNGSGPLRAGHYSEDLNAAVQDVRGAFGKPGWYTLGRRRKATVTRNERGTLQLVELERVNEKERA